MLTGKISINVIHKVYTMADGQTMHCSRCHSYVICSLVCCRWEVLDKGISSKLFLYRLVSFYPVDAEYERS